MKNNLRLWGVYPKWNPGEGPRNVANYGGSSKRLYVVPGDDEIEAARACAAMTTHQFEKGKRQFALEYEVWKFMTPAEFVENIGPSSFSRTGDEGIAEADGVCEFLFEKRMVRL